MKDSPRRRSEIATHRPSSWRGIAAGFFLGLTAAFALACGIEGKKEVAKTALDAMDEKGRADTFEGTLRVLDDHPDYIDQIYELTKKHPKVLDRIVADASVDLKDKPFAELAARHIVENPESLETVLVVTLPIIAKAPKARAAVNRALVVDAEVATDIATDDSATLSRLIEAALPTLEKKPSARKNVLAAVHKDRAKIIAFVKEDPQLAKELGEQLIRELVKDKPTIEKMLRAAKVLDDDPVPPPPTAPGTPAAATQAPSVPAKVP